MGGVNVPRMPAMEKYAPELYAHSLYWGQAWGRPAHFIDTDTAWMPLGNRLFLQTVGHLYCLGDPARPYDWNPNSRPERIRALLRAGRTAASR